MAIHCQGRTPWLSSSRKSEPFGTLSRNKTGSSSSKGSGWRPSKAASLTHPTPILRPRMKGCPPLPRPQPRPSERLRSPQRVGTGKTRRSPRCGSSSAGASSAGGRVLDHPQETARIVARGLAPVVSELASLKGEAMVRPRGRRAASSSRPRPVGRGGARRTGRAPCRPPRKRRSRTRAGRPPRTPRRSQAPTHDEGHPRDGEPEPEGAHPGTAF